MTRNKKRLIIATVLFLIVVWLSFQVSHFFAVGFGAGSYPYAETYSIHASEGEVIAVVRELQKEDPTLKPPGIGNPISIRDPDSPYPDYWRLIDFYYPDTKEVVHTWTRPNDSTSTTFAFYAVNNKIVNQDYWYITNKLEIRKFRKRIFERIVAKIAERKKKKQVIN